ncbi:autoinducer-2 kinase [Bacillus sp. DX1.1]|uniref:autoinducer-2 kinase n=1 Tax=unclassified Bacillus (in: firmicutes) TaxID=185979 RepID=UPI00256FD067|nr:MULTISPECIES: autoinducer-2 kinase [unclassified Bacillus (in: firmicutes)]MDM5155314.1 autoinducer-2 kinase [Bacillus sp. DX1.1]WJE79631.1 autoinducer-2 kinase [Bacillus sp. DX3.1]
MSALLAYDAGTGSVRAVLFDLQGNQLAVSQREWIHTTDSRYPGSMNFDVMQNWELIQECTKDVLKKSNLPSSSIKGISATSMREGFVLYDKSGQEIWACANVDGRASIEVNELKKIRSHLEEDLYKKSGQTFALGALPRLLWIAKHQPDIYERAQSFTMLNDWILYKLCGELQIDPSNGCTSGVFHLQNRNWDKELAEQCGLSLLFTPKVNEAGTVIGAVTKQSAEVTGLHVGTPVVSGGGDAQMASLGSGVVKPGQTFICGGSFWQQEINITAPKVDPNAQIRVNCHVVPTLWQYETIAFFPGLVMRWFRDAFCQEEKQLASNLGVDAYELLEEQAKHVPVGSHGIIPIFSDVMNYISWRHAAPSFINLSLDAEKCGKKEFFRAIEENAAFVTLGNFKLIEALTGQFPTEVVFAGGASKGKLWSQIVADVLGVPVKVPVVKEAAALGTAIVAGVGAGIYDSMETVAEQFVQWETTYKPNATNHKLYQQFYENWKAVYQKQLPLADQGFTSHMWIAPGAL